MSDLISLLMPFSFGLLLGLVFFGGLWLTVSKVITFKNPGIWFLASMLLRTGIVVLGFYLAGGSQLDRFMACLLGFIAVRIVMTRTVKTSIPAIPDENNQS